LLPKGCIIFSHLSQKVKFSSNTKAKVSPHHQLTRKRSIFANDDALRAKKFCFKSNLAQVVEFTKHQPCHQENGGVENIQEKLYLDCSL